MAHNINENSSGTSTLSVPPYVNIKEKASDEDASETIKGNTEKSHEYNEGFHDAKLALMYKKQRWCDALI